MRRQPTTETLLIPAEELARMLSISVRTLWRLRSARKLPPPVHVGGCLRWRLQSVREWIDAGCPKPPQS